MPSLFVLGSLNIDRVYRLPRPLRGGETMTARSYAVGAGGKGANQSLAAARAGASVRHIGCVGGDGRWLVDILRDAGVDTGSIQTVDAPTGHAAVLVDPEGANSIVVDPGANARVTPDQVREALAQARAGDLFLLQNETSAVADAILLAKQAGLPVAFNLAPFAAGGAAGLPIDQVDFLILNEWEAEGLCGRAAPDAHAALDILTGRYPAATIILTRGPEGAYVAHAGAETWQAMPPLVRAVDTTGAGDTFIGYWLAARLEGASPRDAVARACRAAALCVSRPGAAESVPFRHEVDAM